MTVQPKFLSNHSSPLQFSDNLSYCFDGDLAQLGAQLRIADSEALQTQRYSLQLWACSEPFQGGELQGVRIAEVPVVAQSPQASIQQQAPAHYPVGQTDYAMVMALVSEADDGQTVISDYVNFDLRQRFVQPQLTGNVTLERQGQQIQVSIDGIENPRNPQNVSGSLSVELWTVGANRNADVNAGEWLAGINLGQLTGGQCWINQVFTLELAAELPAQCLLLLREWTGNGFVTRDFRALAGVAAQPVNAVVSEAVPANDVSPVETKPKTTQPKVTKPKVSAAASTAQVSINSASEDELANVTGLNAKLARLIVAGRPYLAIDELVKVRGIGVRMIQKLRSLLRL